MKYMHSENKMPAFMRKSEKPDMTVEMRNKLTSDAKQAAEQARRVPCPYPEAGNRPKVNPYNKRK